MTTSDSLLRRLARVAPRERARPTLDEIERSVCDNIERILRSKQGLAPAVPDYGLPDINHVVDDFAEAGRALALKIQETVKTYEPRLKNVKVLPPKKSERDEDPLILHLRIRGEIVTRDGSKRTKLDTILAPSGWVEVSQRT